MSSPFTRTVIGALSLAAGLLAGCGGGDDSASGDGDPSDTVQTFYEAFKSEDAAGICATFSDDFETVVAEGSDSCEVAFQTNFDAGAGGVPEGVEIGDASIDGDTATVDVTTPTGETNTATLIDEDGWKIDGLSGVGESVSSDDITDSTTG